uniref:Uncharacterized protein n=1 Tax=Arundo donax TaxID=35708 RepID=A0A0A9HM71_ARUDO
MLGLLLGLLASGLDLLLWFYMRKNEEVGDNSQDHGNNSS